MEIAIFQVDAFAVAPFSGNPAAVCLLDRPRDDSWMQQVAAEMNLSETAFLTRRRANAPESSAEAPLESDWSLRWFTPAVEVPLCGHATLASAHVLWETGALAPGATARFETRSGILAARRVAGSEGRRPRIEIDLPAYPVAQVAPPAAATSALGDPRVLFCGRTADRGLGDVDLLFELESEAAVRALRPDFARLGREVPAGVIATARAAAESAERYDFVSRYFAPAFGIDEDPVTGAAHCALAPYWTARLGREALVGYQASARGGFVGTRVAGDRALLTGDAVTVVRGALVA